MQKGMKGTGLFVFLLFLAASGAVFAQSLVATWVSDAPLLKMAHFSLTFRSDMTYEVDCTLGRTAGTYSSTEDRILFSPITVGINAGSAGDTQVYYYTFGDESALYLHANGIKVKLKKAEQ